MACCSALRAEARYRAGARIPASLSRWPRQLAPPLGATTTRPAFDRALRLKTCAITIPSTAIASSRGDARHRIVDARGAPAACRPDRAHDDGGQRRYRDRHPETQHQHAGKEGDPVAAADAGQGQQRKPTPARAGPPRAVASHRSGRPDRPPSARAGTCTGRNGRNVAPAASSNSPAPGCRSSGRKKRLPPSAA